MIRLSTAFLALAATASAQTFTYTLDPQASSVVVAADLTLDLTGDLRGVHDAATNPSGTRTVLGLFGDPGTNALVPLSLGIGLDLDLGGATDGGFVLGLDLETGVASATGLDFAIGTSSDLDLEVTFVYDTFRTFDPTALFLGGFPLTIPLGTATVSNVALTQSADGLGVVTPSALPGQVDITVLVPVELTLDVDLGGLFGGGGSTPIGPIPLILPIVATVDLADCDTLLSADGFERFDATFPPPVPISLDDLAFDLPTILPPGGTANTLLSVTLDNVIVAGSITTALSATATDGRVELVCQGSPNSAGNGADLTTSGSTSVTAADLVFLSTALPIDSFGYMLMSQSEDFVPGFGGSQGTLCIGQPAFRFSASIQNSGILGEITFGPDFANLPAGQQFIEGESWIFQYWYRDANPGPTANTTDALRVTFCR